MKKGEVIVITDGSYSDYQIMGIFKVKKEFDIETILGKIHPFFNSEYVDSLNKYDSKIYMDLINSGYANTSKKIKWLIDNEYLGKEIDYNELNMDC